MSTSKKRKRKDSIKITNDISNNESLELVASMMGPIKNIALTTVDKEILLDRLKIELLDKYHFFLKSQSKASSSSPPALAKQKLNEDEDENNKDATLTMMPVEVRQSIYLRKHLIVGTNECTRVLEKAIRGGYDENNENDAVPALVMLSRDLRPPTIVAHFPYLCKQLDIPIALLPGKASSDIGRVLGRRVASVVVFMRSKHSKNQMKIPHRKKNGCNIEKDISKRMSSYIDFAISKIPTKEPA
mmetsp:Transcript_10645/g.16044  ORF Transcript_10645/g.16044 Transcript_10645/m.16044 type:complete len:244 (+) Transcript_10645:40-771(+)